MFDTTKFRRVMLESGLTKIELAGLYGVSRQTLYTWRTEGPKQPTLALRAEKYTDGLLAAMERGLLPFAASTTAAQRASMLAKMAVQLHKLTSPKV